MPTSRPTSDISRVDRRAIAAFGRRSTRNSNSCGRSSALAADVKRAKAPIPEELEDHRDMCWCRESARQIETALDAEQFIEQVGFTACLTDSRRPGPSLYVAVCGRRDAVLPRNVQKDEEASLTWTLKDELMKRANVYYAKLARGKATFVARRMIPHFHAIWGMK